MRMALIVVLLAACGGGHATPPPATPTPTPPPATGSATPEHAPKSTSITPEAVCDKVMALKGSCKQMASLDMTRGSCVAQFKESASTPGEKDAMDAVGHCFIDLTSCEEVMNCVMAASEKLPQDEQQNPAAATDKPDHDCDPKWATAKDRAPAFGAARVSRADYDKRNGAGVTAFKAMKSSKDKPIEVCGIPAEGEWLSGLACGNGTKPVTRANVETFRKGSLGPGGRCGSIIDQYTVTCPEASYDIYIDAYVCPSK